MANLSIRSPAATHSARPTSSGSFLSRSSSPSGSEDDNPLPFPAALARSDFLAPDFDPTAYLSSLAHRHQTLEDLRSDLRERSAAISAELLELVNANYTSFLSLGDELKGGEDRVEDVRVALLGFRRAVEEINGRVRERRIETSNLCSELGGVRRDIETGRKMLELDERLSALEAQLAVASTGPESDESEEEDEDGEALDGPGLVGSSAAKLTALVREYMILDELAVAIGRETPFVAKAEERMTRCRNTILLDLSTALKEARKIGVDGQAKVMKLLRLYAVMDAQAEAVRALKAH